jgi:hypothetical protein
VSRSRPRMGVPSVRAVESSAPTDHVWAVISRPERWREWSPHVQGAQGLGTPEVKDGASGAVVLRGGLRIPAPLLDEATRTDAKVA